MAKKTRIGQLKRRVQIVKGIKTTSTTGTITTEEEVVKNCFAQQIEVSGNEEEEGKVRSLFSTVFIVRYDAVLIKGKASEMFVVDEYNCKYNIISVIEKTYKQYLQINTIRRE